MRLWLYPSQSLAASTQERLLGTHPDVLVILSQISTLRPSMPAQVSHWTVPTLS
jgi:hypothetical protein